MENVRRGKKLQRDKNILKPCYYRILLENPFHKSPRSFRVWDARP